jgi:hypothetical protein
MPLPVSFWIETALLAVSAIVLWMTVAAVKRDQMQRRPQALQTLAIANRRRPTRRAAP